MPSVPKLCPGAKFLPQVGYTTAPRVICISPPVWQKDLIFATPNRWDRPPGSDPAPSAFPGEFQPRVRDLRLYLSVRFSSTLGTQIQSVAVGWQVYDMTRDPVALGYVGLCIFLPMVLLVLPAGDLADRIDRRRMLMASYVVQVLASALLLLLTLSTA